MARWNYSDVSLFVEENSEALLLTTKFKNTKSLMKFKCKCGNPFETTFERFRLHKRQCDECGRKMMVEKQKLSYEEVKTFIENAGCELLDEEFNNTKEKLHLKCSCGEPFEKSFEKFKSVAQCCPKCSYEKISNDQTFTYEFVKTFVEENSNCKLTSQEYNSISDYLNFECECGEPFSTTFSSFRHNNQRSCKKCSNSQSKGEQIIELFLKENNLKYETQFKFDDLLAKNNRQKLRFDFAVFKDERINLIEFDGKQHFQEVEYFGGNEAFETLKYNDNNKNEYCKLNNLNLIRIPYFEINNIANILTAQLM